MEYLTVGQTRQEWRGFPEGYLMSYDDYNGLTLFFFLDSPEERVLEQVRAGNAFEIGLADIGKVGFFTLRFGDLPFGDCAFAPSMYAPSTPIAPPPPGGGIPLNVVVIDAAQGAIVALRTIPLGYDFSVKFSNWFANRMDLDISREQFRQVVNDTYATYGTEELWGLANISWRTEF